MKTDSLFYRLFQSDPSLAFELAGVVVSEPKRYRFGSHEIKQTAFRLDGVLEPPADSPQAPLVFVEVQFQPDADFYLRFLSEILLFLRQYGPASCWRAVVFYPDSTVERVNPGVSPLLELPNLDRIYLKDLRLQDSPNPKHWLIALFLAQDTELPEVVEKIRKYRPENPKAKRDWLDLLETILVYKLPRLSREEIRTMFEYNDIELKQTRFYQEAFNEGHTEGHSEGRSEGHVEGHTQGIVEGEAALLLRQLQHRFGALPDSVKQRIATADADILLVWGERLLEAKSLNEIWDG